VRVAAIKRPLDMALHALAIPAGSRIVAVDTSAPNELVFVVEHAGLPEHEGPDAPWAEPVYMVNSVGQRILTAWGIAPGSGWQPPEPDAPKLPKRLRRSKREATVEEPAAEPEAAPAEE
jgi:hypothetical protein